MAEESLEEDYREVLDGVVNIHMELLEDRPYDMVGRRINFSRDYRPVDILIADFSRGDVTVKYVETGDEDSDLRKKARDEFAEILNRTEWDSATSATRREVNSSDLYDSRLKGNIYAPQSRSSANEFLRRFTEFDLSEFEGLEVLED